MSISNTVKLNIAAGLLACFLSTVVWLTVDYQSARFSHDEKAKAAVLAAQIAERLEIFATTRTRGLDEIADNWPYYHPNIQEWFTKLSLSIRNMLPGISHVMTIDSKGDAVWAVPSHIAAYYPQLIPDDYHNNKQTRLLSSFMIENRQQAIAVIKPTYTLHDEFRGWLMMTFKIQDILALVKTDQLSDAYFLSLSMKDATLYSTGTDSAVSNMVEERIQFADGELSLKLGLKQPAYNRTFSLFIGLAMALIITAITRVALSNTLKASQRHRQFKAACEASLDGLLLFKTQSDKLWLSELNQVARQMLLINEDFPELDYPGLLDKLGLAQHKALCEAPMSVRMGKVFDLALPVECRNQNLEHIKIQIVPAGKGIAVTIRDISNRKRSEFELVKREEKYRRLVDGLTSHFLYSYDNQGNLNYVSGSVSKILGFSAEYFIQQYGRECSHYVKHSIAATDPTQVSNSYQLDILDENQQHKLIEFTDTKVYGEQGQLIAIEGIAKDVTEERHLAEKISYQATHDSLTGLYNRYAFDDVLADTHEQVQHSNLSAVLCYMDLDQFKVVNDTCGHIAGDELLKQLGNLIKNTLCGDCVIARLGGDEFGIIFQNHDLVQAKQVATELLNDINYFRFGWKDKVFQIGASMGMVSVNASSNLDEIMQAADAACYVAKDAGRNRIHLYTEFDEALSYHKSRISWVNRIQQALENDSFSLYFQYIKPINPPIDKLHYEILLRLRDGDQVISPGLFIPAAERFGLMPHLDKWVFNQTIKYLNANPELVARTDKCSINLSGNSITDESFADYIIAQLKVYNIPASKICFEITETAAVTKLSHANAFIEKLRNIDCKFALDDFGAGMCSFSYLKHLPVDYVKIDGSFVKNMTNDIADRAIVKSVNDIAKSLHLPTIAEFVGDDLTEQALRDLGVNYVQGYAINQPQPIEEINLNGPRFVPQQSQLQSA
ncbi:hypothetical protein C2869_16915 [Saccharobesus litoralis]|uniref:Uncharacterized protein n=1 Tax=Saccharobesus litoralis TaxID=2172099 RepID=A0A2S0VUV4_9ALTE|nr:EAL domain-containing protein [Saccharobesus litoralis]AWB68001.1 hypothetical protein C2869_16915 [Saccharobesus litoralis]